MLIQTVDVFLNESAASHAGGEDLMFTGKESVLELLESLGKAAAIGAETGEDVDEISTGSINLKVGADIKILGEPWLAYSD